MPIPSDNVKSLFGGGGYCNVSPSIYDTLLLQSEGIANASFTAGLYYYSGLHHVIESVRLSHEPPASFFYQRPEGCPSALQQFHEEQQRTVDQNQFDYVQPFAAFNNDESLQSWDITGVFELPEQVYDGEMLNPTAVEPQIPEVAHFEFLQTDESVTVDIPVELDPTSTSATSPDIGSALNVCTHPGCSKGFKSERHLANHMKRHTRPRKCPISNCRERFPDQKDVSRHIAKSHHGVPVVCPAQGCSKTFAGRKDALLRHLQGRKHIQRYGPLRL